MCCGTFGPIVRDWSVKEDFMELITFVAVMFPLLIITHEISMAKLEDVLMSPKKHHKKITKRQAPVDQRNSKTSEEFNKFVEEKLIQHSQALEHLIKLSNDAVNAIGSLAENVGRKAEEPKLPEKVDAYHQEGDERISDAKESRRFMGSLPLSDVSNIKNGSESERSDSSSQWCSVAVLCHRTLAPVCGYDDRFGFGKFDDLCHMLQVNCYWKYNFALVPNCRPTF